MQTQEPVQVWVSLCSGMGITVFRYGYHCVQVWVSLCSGMGITVFRYGYHCVQVWVSLCSDMGVTGMGMCLDDSLVV